MAQQQYTLFSVESSENTVKSYSLISIDQIFYRHTVRHHAAFFIPLMVHKIGRGVGKIVVFHSLFFLRLWHIMYNVPQIYFA